ncbi:hypothetical protein CISG_00604 [Coccidioides immitis RMSCC 3703]|uniref:Uncharacterized protein n=1 Tax=Coccidioides immitis RMSCC 3703 TaxID=454286 RepID=A0A0J8QQ56_COCIT|nr:hypothetical protein CISG_00604 [Coccidioides immitis RMSCC 3703]
MAPGLKLNHPKSGWPICLSTQHHRDPSWKGGPGACNVRHVSCFRGVVQPSRESILGVSSFMTQINGGQKKLKGDCQGAQSEDVSQLWFAERSLKPYYCTSLPKTPWIQQKLEHSCAVSSHSRVMQM